MPEPITVSINYMGLKSEHILNNVILSDLRKTPVKRITNADNTSFLSFDVNRLPNELVLHESMF
jgi:hypothetical protein